MADLLLELLCEELPLWAQRSGRREIRERLCSRLQELGFLQDAKSVRDFATPRRLTLVIGGLQESIPPRQEQRRGPRADAPENAINGFCKSVGMKRGQLQQQGDYLYAVLETPGENLVDVLARIIPEVIVALPWQKSMRWGEQDLLFPRPLRGILCLVDGKIVAFEIAGVKSGNSTRGHRFLAPDAFEVTGFADYEKKLSDNKVILDSRKRQKRIQGESEKLSKQQGVRLVENVGLLEEAAASTEYPVPVLCAIGEEYMGLPDEVLLQVVCGQQKYLATRKKNSRTLAPFCIAVANIYALDGGGAIRLGNERVLRARLSDADFFYKRDVEQWKPPHGKDLQEWQEEFIEASMKDLGAIVFHEHISLEYQSDQIADYAAEMVTYIDYFRLDDLGQARKFNSKDAIAAARLAKVDLLSEVVREFPALQGVMGSCYARHAEFSESIFRAIGEQYRPRGIDDSIPKTPLGQCLSLAEKLRNLALFWKDISLRPSGTGDAYGLRRAALGVIRILLEGKIELPLKTWIRKALARESIAVVIKHDASEEDIKKARDSQYLKLTESLFAFFIERLKVYLRQRKNLRPDLVEAVLFHSDDLLEIYRRVEALAAYFPDTEEGKAVLKGYKRAANILRDEKVALDAPAPDKSLLKEAAEKKLHRDIIEAQKDIEAAMSKNDYRQAVENCALLRKPIDDFFDQVRVNVEDSPLRDNRLRLLAQTCRTLEKVADFSKISDK